MAPRPPFAAGLYNTPLSPMDELQFRDWLQKNNVPFNPDVALSDYDMRGFWRALMQGHPQAQAAINPNDNKLHYPDYWKTPLHQSFSNESQYASPGDPKWINNSQLAQGGRILYDEKAPQGILGLPEQGSK